MSEIKPDMKTCPWCLEQQKPHEHGLWIGNPRQFWHRRCVVARAEQAESERDYALAKMEAVRKLPTHRVGYDEVVLFGPLNAILADKGE